LSISEQQRIWDSSEVFCLEWGVSLQLVSNCVQNGVHNGREWNVLVVCACWHCCWHLLQC
jgi:hypothetical protein